MAPIEREHWNKLTNSERRLLLDILRFLVWLQSWRIPRPIIFAFKAALFSFGLIWIMPLEPISIPAAFGGGLSAALISEAI